jgi:hypothetical protein
MQGKSYFIKESPKSTQNFSATQFFSLKDTINHLKLKCNQGYRLERKKKLRCIAIGIDNFSRIH